MGQAPIQRGSFRPTKKGRFVLWCLSHFHHGPTEFAWSARKGDRHRDIAFSPCFWPSQHGASPLFSLAFFALKSLLPQLKIPRAFADVIIVWILD